MAVEGDIPLAPLPFGWQWFQGVYTAQDGHAYGIDVPAPDWASAREAITDVHPTGRIDGVIVARGRC